MIDFSRKVFVPEQILVRQLDDEIVILDLKSENYYGLDDVGASMWNQLTVAESIEQAFEALLQQYDVTPEQLRVDLQDLLKQLLDEQLLGLSDG